MTSRASRRSIGIAAPLVDLPVDRRRGQRDIERDVVVARRQRLQIGADLVGDIAARGRAVGADDAEIDQALPHQVAAGIVDDDRVRDAVLAELPGGEAGALVARPGLVDPDMDRDAVVMGAIDRRQRGAPIDGREPAGVAMGQDLDRRSVALAPPGLGDQPRAVLADRAVDRDIRFGDLAGPRQSRGKSAALRHARTATAASRPAPSAG